MVDVLLQTYRDKEIAMLLTHTKVRLLGKLGDHAQGLCSRPGSTGQGEQARGTFLCS